MPALHFHCETPPNPLLARLIAQNAKTRKMLKCWNPPLEYVLL